MPSNPSPLHTNPNSDRIALAAKASLVCPFVVVLIALITSWSAPGFRVIGELAAGAVAVIGLICAIVALTQGRRSAGSSSIALQGGIGLLIGLVFVGIVLNNYLRAQRNGQAEGGMAESRDASGISPQTGRLSEAVARFVARTTELEQRLVVAAKPLAESPVLDLTGVESAEALLTRQSIVKVYIEASHALSNHLAQAQSFLEGQLTGRGASPAEASAIAGEFLKHIDAQLSTADQIRALEYDYTRTLIEALELLRNRWGAWNIQPQGTPVFDLEEDSLQYGSLLKRLDEFEARDRALKQRLSNP
jgi:hypothetical protein